MKAMHVTRLLSLVLALALVFTAAPSAHAFTLEGKETAPAGAIDRLPDAPEIGGTAPILNADELDPIEETEPNNSAAQAQVVPLDTILVGETSAEDKQDVYKFTLNKTSDISFTSYSSAPNMIFAIFAMSDSTTEFIRLATCLYYGLEDDVYVDAINIRLQADTYYLVVQQTDVEGGPDAYAGPLFYSLNLHIHDLTVTETKEPTCIEEGYKEYACGCREKLEKLPHNYVAGTAVPPTCTESGYTPYTCSTEGCTATQQDNFVNPLGHEMDEDTLTFLPETKEHSYSCTRCEETVKDQCNFEKDTATGKYLCTVCGGEAGTMVFRLAGDDRIRTSMAIADALKEELGVAKFDTVIVASALNFPDALTGSYLATVKNAPILLTYDAVNADVVSYITLNMDYDGTVYILGGESAVSGDFEYRLKELDITYKRLAGSDRFGTNLAILKEAGGVLDSDLVICTAYGFADSLSASASGKPILLVGDKLTEEQKEFLKENASGFFCVIGGTGVVSEALVEELNPYAAADIVRLAGRDRYETSVLVAQRFYPAPTDVVLAYARNYPDGLCGGPLAHRMDAPLILTDGNCSWANSYMTDLALKGGLVLGGSSLIEDAIVRTLFSLAENEPIPAK